MLIVITGPFDAGLSAGSSQSQFHLSSTAQLPSTTYQVHEELAEHDFAYGIIIFE